MLSVVYCMPAKYYGMICSDTNENTITLLRLYHGILHAEDPHVLIIRNS
jgi:hypothetical protein